MSDKNSDTANLPMKALNEIPTPNADAQHITALVKDRNRVVGYPQSHKTRKIRKNLRMRNRARNNRRGKTSKCHI
jgi:hypothetical protein